jgi:hypothetical protein
VFSPPIVREEPSMTVWGYIQPIRVGQRKLALVIASAMLLVNPRLGRAEISIGELTRLVKTGIDDQSLLCDPPRVLVLEGELSYEPGKIFYPDYADKPTRPIGFPIDAIAKVELIRKYRADQKAELESLEPYLERVRKLASDELDLIAKHHDSQAELLKQLADRNDQVQRTLREGIQTWANKQGLRLAKPLSAMAAIPTVKIQTVPAGGTVYFLNAVDYNVCKAAGALDEIDRWNQVAGPQMDIGGAYYFRAAWPGGKSKQTAKILIDRPQTISIQAE